MPFSLAGRYGKSKLASELVSSVDTGFVIADRAYDFDEIILPLSSSGMAPIIPARIGENFSGPVISSFRENGTPSKTHTRE
ncbi:MAG: hypothetical protein LBB18_01800 [Puniceicoccales bacterium]|jgi:hypothetical protein|nr:hypothetical protein [Puniceicoccales bacterium]